MRKPHGGGMLGPNPYAGWSLSDRLQMLAFEARLAHLPRSLIEAAWEGIDLVRGLPAKDAGSVRMSAIIDCTLVQFACDSPYNGGPRAELRKDFARREF